MVPVVNSTQGFYLSAMPMHPLIGHHQARRRLAASYRSGRLPQVILLTGPEGVGKQRLGLWLAQLLFCGEKAEEPCGRCRACKLVLELSHPDLHWFVPVPRPKAADPDKQIEEVGELLAEAMAARRAEPWCEPADGMSAHPLASAKLVLRRAALTPVEGSRKVFILGEADRLVPQESSPEAANALLKLLEEPPADTWIVLTTTEPERVLPTIRSRAVPLRLATLPKGSVPTPPGVEERSAKAGSDARALLETIKAGRAARLERSLKQAPWSARGGFTDMLDALAEELAGRARAAKSGATAERLVRALERVQIARVEAQGNVNPQLLLASLAGELEEVL